MVEEVVVIVPITTILVDIHHSIPIIIEEPMIHIVEGQEEGVRRLVGMT